MCCPPRIARIEAFNWVFSNLGLVTVPYGIFKIPWMCPRKKLEPPAKKLKTRWGTPPPPFDPYIYQSIALDVRIPNLNFLIDLTGVVQKLCFLQPPAVHNM